MDFFNELKETWRRSENHQSEVQQRMWDRVAESYKKKPVPSFEDNYFLQYIEQILPLTKEVKTLDVGCGSGIYSMALSERVGKAVGVDISPKMIEYANLQKDELGLTNVEFSSIDWALADIDELGFRGAFDVVFAHMTPAIADFETFDKFIACSRSWCLMEKPTRRRDLIQDEVFRLLGIDRSEEQDQASILQAFSYLWFKGYCPQFYYHEEEWKNEKTLEDMAAWCIDRASLHRELTEEDEQRIHAFLSTKVVDGMVQEITTTTKVTVIWKIKKE